MTLVSSLFFFFFFNDTATTEIYTLSLHDALPIYVNVGKPCCAVQQGRCNDQEHDEFHCCIVPLVIWRDRKSTRLNSSHLVISYAVFCLKKKNNTPQPL